MIHIIKIKSPQIVQTIDFYRKTETCNLINLILAPNYYTPVFNTIATKLFFI